MVAGASPDAVARYEDLTGVALEPDVLHAHRLLWALSDVAAFTHELRDAHRGGADAERALAGLRDVLAGREPAPYGEPGA
jgi:hypothetical protein